MARHLQRLFAVLLLGAQVLLGVVALGVAESGHCECRHGAEVSCDCPHHAGAAGKDLPACHRKLLAQKAAEERKTPGFKAHCASSRPELLIPVLATVPRTVVARTQGVRTVAPFAHVPAFASRVLPPPQAPPPRPS